MPRLIGIEYTSSLCKQDADGTYKRMLLPLTAGVEKLAVSALASRRNGASPYYNDFRVSNHNELQAFPKVRTMREVCEDMAEETPGFHKENPRIYGRVAKIIRDLGLDELPQLGLVPESLSFVGPRPLTESFLDYSISEVGKLDAGVARDFEELYLHPDIRHGVTGPGQLKWAWSDERSPQLLGACMRADVEYYTETATALSDLGIILKTPATLVGSSAWKLILNHRAPTATS